MTSVIIGAGLAGLSAAHHLGKDWIIFEKASKVGGLASSDREGGFTFDKTGHLLHMHHAYTKAWLIEGLLQGRLAEHQRNTWIFSKDIFTRYPFQANTYGLPDKVIVDCVVSFLKTRDRITGASKNPNFHRWNLETFGPGISRHFMFPYNLKLWRTPLEKITTEWIRNFVPIPSREEVLYGALTDQKKFFGYNASFFYPREGGIQMLPDALAGQLAGSEIYLNSEILKINWKKKEVVTARGKFSYDWLINTSPLDEFLDRLEPCLAGEFGASARRKALRYTVVYNLNLGLTNPRPSLKHWVYFPEKKHRFYRIGTPTNFASSLAPEGCSAFYVEFAGLEGESFNYQKMLDHTLAAMRAFGWMRPRDEVAVARWNRISPAYVVFTKERRDFLPKIFELLKKRQILSIGRYGAWKYSFMEECLLDGKSAAEQILLEGGKGKSGA